MKGEYGESRKNESHQKIFTKFEFLWQLPLLQVIRHIYLWIELKYAR